MERLLGEIGELRQSVAEQQQIIADQSVAPTRNAAKGCCIDESALGSPGLSERIAACESLPVAFKRPIYASQQSPWGSGTGHRPGFSVQISTISEETLQYSPES